MCFPLPPLPPFLWYLNCSLQPSLSLYLTLLSFSLSHRLSQFLLVALYCFSSLYLFFVAAVLERNREAYYIIYSGRIQRLPPSNWSGLIFLGPLEIPCLSIVTFFPPPPPNRTTKEVEVDMGVIPLRTRGVGDDLKNFSTITSFDKCKSALVVENQLD